MSSRYRSGNAALTARQDRAFEAVNKVLGKTLRKFGLDNEIARYRFVLHWKEIVGEQIAAKTRPECIKNQALVVRVIDSAWAQELAFQKPVILKRLKSYIDREEIVKDMIFYVGDLRA